jgi:hypothetical protein
MDLSPYFQLLSYVWVGITHNPGQATALFVILLGAVVWLCCYVGKVCWNNAKSHARGAINALNERLKLKDEQKQVTEASLKTANGRIARLEAEIKARDVSKEQLAMTASVARHAVGFAEKANNDPIFAQSLTKEAKEQAMGIDDFVEQLIRARGSLPSLRMLRDWRDSVRRDMDKSADNTNQQH